MLWIHKTISYHICFVGLRITFSKTTVINEKIRITDVHVYSLVDHIICWIDLNINFQPPSEGELSVTSGILGRLHKWNKSDSAVSIKKFLWVVVVYQTIVFQYILHKTQFSRFQKDIKYFRFSVLHLDWLIQRCIIDATDLLCWKSYFFSFYYFEHWHRANTMYNSNHLLIVSINSGGSSEKAR